MKYKLAIFDFDGTLANSFPWFLGVLNRLADKHGFRRISGEEIEAMRGYDTRRILAHLGIPIWKVPFIARHMRALMAAEAMDIRPFDGVDILLRDLTDNGVTLAIVTSNSLDNVRTILGPENAGRISHFECGASLFGKPARFRRVLKRTGFTCADAICIGDEIRDFHAATGENIAFGAVSWGYATADTLRALAPAEMFATVGEIAERLLVMTAHAGAERSSPLRPEPSPAGSPLSRG